MLIDFAVFVSGVFYIVRRLAAFLTALCVILIAFAQMFHTVFQQTDYCQNQPNDLLSYEEILQDTQCEASEVHPYCNFWNSFVSVYTMLLGEVDDKLFQSSGVAIALYIIFMFLVVILLANVLIAIVTDSYKVVQDQRAAIVFWTNRLDFIAEMDAIANGPWKNRLKGLLGCGRRQDSSSSQPESVFGKEFWKQLMELFEDDVEEGSTCDFMAYTALRLLALIVIPLWIVLGLFTAGWLWPPQVREGILTSTVFKHSSDAEKHNELRRNQVKQLQRDVKELNDELLQELAFDRTQMVQLKSLVADRKVEISNEMRQIKRIVAVLFDRQGTFSA
jgi:hypothetical protein